jgi:hypothetical protein
MQTAKLVFITFLYPIFSVLTRPERGKGVRNGGVTFVALKPASLPQADGLASNLLNLRQSEKSGLRRMVHRNGQPPSWSGCSAWANEALSYFTIFAQFLILAKLALHNCRSFVHGVKYSWPYKVILKRYESISCSDDIARGQIHPL